MSAAGPSIAGSRRAGWRRPRSAGAVFACSAGRSWTSSNPGGLLHGDRGLSGGPARRGPTPREFRWAVRSSGGQPSVDRTGVPHVQWSESGCHGVSCCLRSRQPVERMKRTLPLIIGLVAGAYLGLAVLALACSACQASSEPGLAPSVPEVSFSLVAVGLRVVASCLLFARTVAQLRSRAPPL